MDELITKAELLLEKEESNYQELNNVLNSYSEIASALNNEKELFIEKLRDLDNKIDIIKNYDEVIRPMQNLCDTKFFRGVLLTIAFISFMCIVQTLMNTTALNGLTFLGSLSILGNSYITSKRIFNLQTKPFKEIKENYNEMGLLNAKFKYLINIRKIDAEIEELASKKEEVKSEILKVINNLNLVEELLSTADREMIFADEFQLEFARVRSKLNN